MNDTSSEHKEPDEKFIPLSENRYVEFYSIEMDNFTEDIEFYREHCTPNAKILELGCGTGRISNALATSGHRITGLDLSVAMLKKAMDHSPRSASYLCMDMTKMAFRKNFDHILIPYNTLNLLKESALINRCLRQANHHLSTDGSLLLQLHIPDKKLIDMAGQKLFQFKMMPLKDKPGMLIKETLRSYDNATQEILMEERYRARPVPSKTRKDFSHTLHLAAFSMEKWIKILEQCGFSNITLFGDYNSRPFQSGTDSILLVKASLSRNSE
jgi:2-polyprenyl-3-methyl-5-hydroxy-6-metoxy-1,4-benzoquinol methylase